MKLYFGPGACSLSPHIVLREAGLPFDLEQVDGTTKLTKSGRDFRKFNPKGMVPALQLKTGDVLTEGPAIVQYIADQAPEAGLVPPAGTLARYRVQEWLNFITSEIHKGFSPLFKANTPEEYKPIVKENLAKHFTFLDEALAGRSYLTGETFTIADAYLFTVLNWSNFLKIDLQPWQNVSAFMQRVAQRPKVQEAMKAEGLKIAYSEAA